MTLYQNKYRVETSRIKGRDYSLPGYYFITTNVFDRKLSFGKIIKGKMVNNEYGEIIQACWDDLPNHYANMKCDSFVIMPDHIHCIIRLHDHARVETGLRPVSTNPRPVSNDGKRKPAPISEIMRALKSFSARRIKLLRKTHGKPVWQPRFYDRIIRDKKELLAVRQYILNNPKNWGKE